MKKQSFPTLSPLALLPLLSMALPASAAVTCAPTATPSAVRPGAEFTLRGNCIDTDTNQPVSAGDEVWQINLGEGTTQVGRRVLPDGTLTVTAPNEVGTFTYVMPLIDGYAGDIEFPNNPPSVVVTVAAQASGQATLDQLTTTLTTLQTARVRSNLQQAETRLRHIRTVKDSGRKQPLDVYVGGLGDLLEQDSSFKSRTTALSIGADYRLTDDWVLGGNVGASKSHVKFEGSGSDQKSTGTQATGYASWSVTPSTYLSATVSYEASKFDVRRDDGGGDLSYASPRGRGLGVSLSGGRDFVAGPWSIGPYVRWDRITSRIDAFSETGGASAVAVGAQRASSDTINLGAQTQFSIPVSWGLVLPYVRLEVSQRKDTTRQSATATLLSDNTTLLVPVASDARNRYGTVALGVAGVQQGGMSWFADYESGFSQDSYRTQRFGLGLRFEI